MSSMSPEQYRAICFSEHGDECEFCETRENVDIHHIDGDRSNNHPKNLLPVCREHHMRIHKRVDGYEEWNDKLLPPSERTLTLESECYIPVDEFTKKVLEEMRMAHDCGVRMVIRHSFNGCLGHRFEMCREMFEGRHTEVLLRDKGRDYLTEIMSDYGFENREDALKSAVISQWEDDQE